MERECFAVAWWKQAIAKSPNLKLPVGSLSKPEIRGWDFGDVWYLRPVYVVARDHDLHWIVVAVRGTLSQNDILTDCAVSSVPFLGGAVSVDWKGID